MIYFDFQAAIEAFIGDAYKARYNETMDKSLISTIFSIAVNAFVVGGMIGGLSGGKLVCFLLNWIQIGPKFVQNGQIRAKVGPN